MMNAPQWTSSKPTEPGKYKARCLESDGEEYECFVYKSMYRGLMVHDDQIGENNLDCYHDNLADLEWLGPITEAP